MAHLELIQTSNLIYDLCTGLTVLAKCPCRTLHNSLSLGLDWDPNGTKIWSLARSEMYAANVVETEMNFRIHRVDPWNLAPQDPS